MQIRRLLATLVASSTLAVVGVVAGPAAPASAYGSCSLYVWTKVAITSPYREVPVRLGPNCASAGVDYASWDAYHPTQGFQDIVIFDGTTTDIVDLYDFASLGRWTWRPNGASDPYYNDVAQNQPTTDVRLGSRAPLAVTRSGSTVRVTTKPTRYAYSVRAFVPWTGVRGTVQYRTSSTAPWVGLKYVYPTSTGASFTYTTNAVRDYRVVYPDATHIWGATSPVVRR